MAASLVYTYVDLRLERFVTVSDGSYEERPKFFKTLQRRLLVLRYKAARKQRRSKCDFIHPLTGIKEAERFLDSTSICSDRSVSVPLRGLRKRKADIADKYNNIVPVSVPLRGFKEAESMSALDLVSAIPGVFQSPYGD